MINTYNESSLHRTLKNLYCPDNAVQEVPLDGFICDIYTQEGKVIEIQTGNIPSLKQKLLTLLPSHPIEIIYPIITDAYILMLNADATKRSYRKSPKHGTFFQIFKEFYGLIPVLEHPHLSIRLLYIDCKVTKIDDKKGRSKYKNPRIIDKQLINIRKQEYWQNGNALITGILERLPEIFVSTDLKTLGAGIYSSYTISFLKKMNKITYLTKAGRFRVYKKCSCEAAALTLPAGYSVQGCVKKV